MSRLTVGQRVVAEIKDAGEKGASQRELCLALDMTKGHVSVEVHRLRKEKLIFSGGASQTIRYFADPDWALAFAPIAAAEVAATEQARLERKRIREQEGRARKRAAREAMPKKPRAKRVVPKIAMPAPATNTPWRADHSKPAPVKIGKAAGPVQIVIPAGVKRTVCPGGRDTRFIAEGPVIGGFSTLGVGRYLESEEEWRRRFGRAA